MDVLEDSNTKEEKFLTSPTIVKEEDDNVNETNTLHASGAEITHTDTVSVGLKKGQRTDNYASNNIELQIARKIDFLGHPLSSELLDRLDKDRDSERVDSDNTGFSSQYDNSKYLHSYPYRCYSVEENRGGSVEYGNITSSYEQENPIMVVRNRSNSKASSSGTRTVRNSSDISPASKIFRNLLILEDDLRQQARQQKRLRWQYTTFYSTLMGVAGFAVYELYFTTSTLVTPEQNYHLSAIYSNNNDNSKYLNHYYVNSNNALYRFMLQLMLMFVITTVFLFYISGQYRRTIILPRRFFNTTNKGIKQFNIRLIKVHSSWDEKFTDLVRFITRNVALIQLWIFCQIFKCGDNVVVRFWENVRIRSQPRIGAVDVKLVLNPKAFSAEVREGWEIYRDEFWAREGARRRKTQSIK